MEPPPEGFADINQASEASPRPAPTRNIPPAAGVGGINLSFRELTESFRRKKGENWKRLPEEGLRGVDSLGSGGLATTSLADENRAESVLRNVQESVQGLTESFRRGRPSGFGKLDENRPVVTGRGDTNYPEATEMTATAAPVVASATGLAVEHSLDTPSTGSAGSEKGGSQTQSFRSARHSPNVGGSAPVPTPQPSFRTLDPSDLPTEAVRPPAINPPPGPSSSAVNQKLSFRRSSAARNSFRATASGTSSELPGPSMAESVATSGVVVESSAAVTTSSRPERSPAGPAHDHSHCLDISWEGVTISGPRGQVLIAGASGSVQGRMLAIMGPSGCGKTTFLNYLACRPKKGAQGSSAAQIHGTKYTRADLKRIAGYVMQSDLVNGRLTVEETLMYTANLRLPATLSPDVKAQKVTDVLAKVGLSHVRKTIVGDPLNKGISGGERKRLCIAIELLTEPKILFLDEPTAGLDSVTALTVMHVLKSLTTSGLCTVLCSISQPQAKIFNLFDDLLLLHQGKIVYNGPAHFTMDFFASKGYPCPDATNPADHMIDVLSVIPSVDQFLASGSVSSPTCKGGDSEIALEDEAHTNPSHHLPYGGDGYEDRNEYTPMPKSVSRLSWFRQFLILFGRCWKDVIRNRMVLYTQFFQSIIMAVLIGTVFLQIGTTQISAVKRTPVLFFLCGQSRSFLEH